MGDLNYDASSIKSLSDKEAMQTRANVYIGSTDIDGMHHVPQEILSNSIDEFMNGFGKIITVHIYADGSIAITDEGRGIPVGLNSDGQEALEVAMTVIHGGAKFSSDGSTGYNSSGGLNGIGLKAATYLSEFCIATVKRDGKIYELKFIDGEKDGDLKVIGESQKTGTKIHFKPSSKYFDDVNISSEFLIERIRELSYLTKGLSFVFCDERTDDYKQPITFLSKNGLLDYVEELNDGYNTISKPFYVNYRDEDTNCEVEAVLQYNDSMDTQIKLYTNNIPNPDGGTHFTGYSSALTRCINAYGLEKGLLKEKDEKFSGADLKEGQTLIINVKMPEPQFGGGNTKHKLNDKRGRAIVESPVGNELKTWLSKNPKDAKAIITKILNTQRALAAAKKAKDKTLGIKGDRKDKKKQLGDIFQDCLSRDSSITELFLCEGNSAAGTVAAARDPKFQAILELGGKILNTIKEKDINKVLRGKGKKANENDTGKIKGVVQTIGGGFGSDFDLKKVNYSKIILVTDQDDDGKHIQILVTSLFWRHMRPLIEAGMVYIAQSPLYVVDRKGKIEYYFSEQEIQGVDLTGCEVNRNKGLGELEAHIFKELSVSPATRTLKRLTVKDARLAEQQFVKLMDETVAPRRQFIEENAHLANIEN